MSTETTTASVARPKSDSLRATIPRGIVVFLGVKEGDQLEWKMDIGPKGKRIAVVKRVE